MADKVVPFRRQADRVTKASRAGVRPVAAELLDEPADAADLLAPIVRSQLTLAPAIDDDMIASSVRDVAAEKSETDRWRAAFASTVGLYLSLTANDFEAELNRFLSLVPKPQS